MRLKCWSVLGALAAVAAVVIAMPAAGAPATATRRHTSSRCSTARPSPTRAASPATSATKPRRVRRSIRTARPYEVRGATSTVSTTPRSPRSAAGEKIYDYVYSFNGFAAKLTAAQAGAAREVAGPVRREERIGDDRHLVHAGVPRSRRVPRRRPLGQEASTGENVVIGVLDSGFWPESQSFCDRDAKGKLAYSPNSGLGTAQVLSPARPGTRRCATRS